MINKKIQWLIKSDRKDYVDKALLLLAEEIDEINKKLEKIKS